MGTIMSSRRFPRVCTKPQINPPQAYDVALTLTGVSVRYLLLSDARVEYRKPTAITRTETLLFECAYHRFDE